MKKNRKSEEKEVSDPFVTPFEFSATGKHERRRGVPYAEDPVLAPATKVILDAV
jgi:hypothetical protein